jgi:hypothetical protein
MKTKRFNCVELQDRGALEIYAETQGMTAEEQVAWWKKQSQELRREFLRSPKKRSGSRNKAKKPALA